MSSFAWNSVQLLFYEENDGGKVMVSFVASTVCSANSEGGHYDIREASPPFSAPSLPRVMMGYSSICHCYHSK